MRQGDALRYLGQQALDRTIPRVLVAWVITVAICLPLHFASARNAPNPDQLRQLVQQLHFQLACLALVVIFHGIVAEDRTKGYYRFYLAKPVSPLWFYGQSFMLAVAGMVLFSVGFMAIFSFMVAPAWHWQLLNSSLALGLLIGGMVFALSTVTARDWIYMIVLAIILSVARDRWPKDESQLGKTLNVLLPPNQLVNERVLTAAEWAWVAGWGLGLIALGLLVLKKRPLGED